MFLKQRKASTDPRLRSLLQKAVRRGFVPIVDRVATRLDVIGDSTWLRSRAVVITFEECWPLGGSISIDRGLSSKLAVLIAATGAAKDKDAAGLGALAHAYREGDRSMVNSVPEKRMLKIVAEALGRPREFFRWVVGETKSQKSSDIVRAAQEYLPVATWQWDKACILAGALLATTADLPTTDLTNPPEATEDFPYWVALDKHTDEGKTALREVAVQIKARYRQLIWASFYCESTQVNSLLPSPWFAAERAWRFARAGVSLDSATELWLRARPLVRERLTDAAQSLRSLVESPPRANALAEQDSLL